MKSKKIVALALTAAMAISMASMTAFAKVDYNDGGKAGDLTVLTAEVTLTKEQYNKALAAGAILKTDADNAEAYTEEPASGTQYISIANLAKYSDLDANYKKLNTATLTFKAWGTAGSAQNLTGTGTGGADKVATDQAKTRVLLSATAKKSDDEYYTAAKLSAEYTTSSTDKDITENLKNIENDKKDEEAAKSRDEQLKAGDEANKAVDNVKTDDGPKTEKATVTGPTAIENSADLHDFKVVNKDMKDSALAWVYQVTKPAGLVDGKNARVTLEAPKGYNPKDYKVAVYHVKGYCTYEKVKGLDIAKTDVTFWANDMSPYVLVLTPTDAVAGTSTGNPSTGDFSAVPVAMLAAAALGATGFVAYKKRKAE